MGKPLWDIQYVNKYAHTHIYIYVHTHIHIYIYVCMCASMYQDKCAHKHTHTCIHTIIYTHYIKSVILLAPDHLNMPNPTAFVRFNQRFFSFNQFFQGLSSNLLVKSHDFLLTSFGPVFFHAQTSTNIDIYIYMYNLQKLCVWYVCM